MVDLQMISDLHKSEVRHLAEHLAVPASVSEVVPSGDMYDGRADEQVFGAPYDFVELYMHWLCARPQTRERWKAGWSAPAQDQFDRWSDQLEKMHVYNAHKYLGRSPAVHLNIIEAAVPGGWQQEVVS
jgi:NAD+ synthase (glutamine-hydrolysing)